LLLRRLIRYGSRAAFALAMATPWACGSTADRPPQEGVLTLDGSDGGADAAQGFQSTAPTELSCNLGPDGGVCACADQPLLGDPPTLYFVLDRSASMSDDDKWRTILLVINTLIIDLGPRAIVAAAVFPNPGSATECGPGVEVMAPTRGDAPAGKAGPTSTKFLTTLGAVGPNGGTPTAATLQSLLATTLSKTSGKTYVILATDGGPNCDGTASCDPTQCEDNIEDVPGCPPGGPFNCCLTSNGGTPLSCLDAQPTTDAVMAIAASGIPVYVLGVPGSAPYASLLDELAQSGGTARSTEPYYYAVTQSDQTAFTSALFSIAAQITATCTLTLDNAPPDPTMVNVFLDEQVLPQEGADGWTLVDQTVTILGKSCQSIMSGDIIDVRVVAGCPTFQR
jgi:hypothetical protein